MQEPQLSMTQQIARAASAFECRRTGHGPTSVSVLMGHDTLVITLRGALSPAEMAVARSPAGAAQMQELYQQLFANDSDALWGEIGRIAGVDVRDATVEAATHPGAVSHLFATGTVVQVFLLADHAPLAGRNEANSGIVNQNQDDVV